jgi:predicted FMN-binding regulatory protein PaiB
MYIPKAFHVSDTPVLEEFIASNSFATLISPVNGTLFATHLVVV